MDRLGMDRLGSIMTRLLFLLLVLVYISSSLNVCAHVTSRHSTAGGKHSSSSSKHTSANSRSTHPSRSLSTHRAAPHPVVSSSPRNHKHHVVASSRTPGSHHLVASSRTYGSHHVIAASSCRSKHHVIASAGTTSHSKHHVIASAGTTGHTRHHHKRCRSYAIARRYAYPMDLFLLQPPGFSSPPLPEQLALKLREDFDLGTAGEYPASALVQAGVVTCLPLHGGIFRRRQPVKYLIMHSTESGVPLDAPHIVNGWNSLGRRHAGAQYIVDRDGHIYQTVDPELATVHVNIFKTLPGINNDNSIGIEMVHAGSQQYTHEQLQSVIRLASYLLQRYQIEPENLITHRYAQRGDHTDPVAFDWNSFTAQVGKLNRKSVSKEMVAITQTGKELAKQQPKYGSGAVVAAETTETATVSASSKTLPATLPTLRGPIEIDPPAAGALLEAK